MSANDASTGYKLTLPGYLTGFVLAVFLTAVPFWVVSARVLPSSVAGSLALGFAAMQIGVHMHYFLHLRRNSEGGWSLLAFAFTTLLVVIVLCGSAWVMNRMNANMMPMAMHSAQAVQASSPPSMQGMQ